jgi:hypothetical protein
MELRFFRRLSTGSPDRCTRDEARGIFFQQGILNASPEVIARLRTLSDEDLIALAQTSDWFALVESNRRLAAVLHREAVRTMWLTGGVFVLTIALVYLTVTLVRSDSHRAASGPAAPVMHSGDGPG